MKKTICIADVGPDEGQGIYELKEQEQRIKAFARYVEGPAVRLDHVAGGLEQFKGARLVDLRRLGSGLIELELELPDGHKGNLWLSKEMWERIGEMAGWRLTDSEEGTAKRFKWYARHWQEKTGHLSDLSKRLAHPLYRTIVGMGWPVVPFLLGELAGEDPDFWGPALREITGERITIALADHGKQKVIAAAWLELAKKKGWRVQSAP